MTLRQLTKKPSKCPSMALFFFAADQKTGIAPTRRIVEKDLDLFEGKSVTVIWEGKKVQGEIIALSDDENVLAAKDLEWYAKNFPDAGEETENEEEEKEATEAKPPTKKFRRNKPTKVQGPEASTTESDDGPYEQFLAGQRQRVLGWKAMRQSKKAKAAQAVDPAPNIVTCSSENPSREDEVVTELRQQLAAKTEECRHLVSRLDAMEEASGKILSCQMQMQEKFIKMLEKIETSMSGMEGKLLEKISTLDYKVGAHVANIEARLDALEGQSLSNFSMLDTTVPENALASEVCDTEALEEYQQTLSTISADALNSLIQEVQPAEIRSAPNIAVANTSLEVRSVHATSTAANSPLEVGEELIGTCVTPRKIREVQQALNQEKQRHLCALKLIFSFFTTEELAASNTDGSHGKGCLDSNKLNSLKVLLFTKFPVGPGEEKEKVWKAIKSKINTKCRVIRKSTQKDLYERSL